VQLSQGGIVLVVDRDGFVSGSRSQARPASGATRTRHFFFHDFKLRENRRLGLDLFVRLREVQVAVFDLPVVTFDPTS